MFRKNRPNARPESLERALGDNPPTANGGRSKSRYDAQRAVKRNQVSGYGKVENVAGTIMSPKEIIAMAVCDLSDNPSDKSCVEDPRMGTKNPGEECPTCTNIHGKCNGHFAMMSVPKVAWFLHPWYVDDGVIAAVMNLFCYPCFRFELQNSTERYNTDYVPAVKFKFDSYSIKTFSTKYDTFSGVSRLKKLAELGEKFPCSSVNGAHKCSTFKKGQEYNIIEVIDKQEAPVDIGIVQLYLLSISNFLERNNLFEFIGFNPVRFENFVITVIPVIPTCNRPTVIFNDKPKESDITTLYLSMLAKIKEIKENENGDASKLIDAKKGLIEGFYGYINSNKPGVKKGKTPETLKTLTQIYSGKKGLFKGNTLSARVDNSGRTVIVGDNDIRPDEVSIPMYLADKFLIRLEVTERNKHVAQNLVKNGIAKILTKNPNGYVRRTIVLDDEDRSIIVVNVADRIYRRLVTGDIVTINRQPTLHRWSFLALKAVVTTSRPFRDVPINTMGLNTSYTGGLNADFDGDEIHIHVPGSIDARAEAAALMGVATTPVSDSTSSNIFALIQNSIWGAYEMTKKVREFTKAEWQQLATQTTDFDGGNVELAENEVSGYAVLRRSKYIEENAPRIFYKNGVKNLGLWNSYTLLSLAFPEDFTYRHASDKDNAVVIEEGILVSGVLSKETVGGGSSSIIRKMFESHGPKAIVIFAHNVQKLVNAWIATEGLTISIVDFAPSEELEERIERVKDIGIRKGKELGQKNVSGVFNQDLLIQLLDNLLGRIIRVPGVERQEVRRENSIQDRLGDDLFGILKSDISYYLFDAMMIERNAFMRGRIASVFRPEQVKKVLDRIIGKVLSENNVRGNEGGELLNEITAILLSGIKQYRIDDIIAFLEDQMENPLDSEHVTLRSKYEKASMEADTSDALASIKEEGLKLVLSKEMIEKGGPLISMIKSKARGQDFHLVQAMFGVGQQTVSGERLRESISGGTRTLPYYLENDPSPESRGFIRSSLFRSLQPGEYYAASAPARQTSTDSSLNTGGFSLVTGSCLKVVKDTFTGKQCNFDRDITA